MEERFWSKVDKTEECWLWTGCTRSGYGLFRVGKKMVSAHRWIYEQENGPIPEGALLRHTCDNPPCVRPDHLIAGSYGDNNRDMRERDRGFSRLTNDLVASARLRAAQGESIHKILEDMPAGVGLYTLAGAIRGQTFSHVQTAPAEPNFFRPIYRKLTKEQYDEIYAALEKPYRGQGKKLAEKYGVHPSLITLIKKGRLKTIQRDSGVSRTIN
jgi:hypothetical protein